MRILPIAMAGAMLVYSPVVAAEETWSVEARQAFVRLDYSITEATTIPPFDQSNENPAKTEKSVIISSGHGEAYITAVDAGSKVLSNLDHPKDEPIDPIEVKYEKDKRTAKALQKAIVALNVVDAAETIAIISNGGSELNPLYGSHPDAARVIMTKALFAMAQYMAIDILVEANPHDAKIVGYAGVAITGGVVAWNMSLLF